MNHPSKKDVRPRKRRKALDKPPDEFEFLAVIDLEWTCDDRRKLTPLEIIEFSGVLLRQRRRLPGLEVVSEFSRYLRPVVNQALTEFCIQLTGISQETVDNGISLQQCFKAFDEWLEANGVFLENETEGSTSKSRLAIVTWSDADCMSAIRLNCEAQDIKFPSRFEHWINLKELYKQHFKKKPVGGLKVVVESLGLTFEGRAHSGIVDARNTVKIANVMSKQGFRFWRYTRNIYARTTKNKDRSATKG